ncbi:type II secretion system GspH family protein [Aeromonas simiae]|uniref:type IV pilus modification PilV family protein n=1 Tax=Aeromonas simiae TaxID=218936 RepID=UPI00266B7501|nr:type II secretion system protein [Aeromonas simiae]MDO2947628.1 type II secretion system GspH family protein [Aeromonas simiae]MDO2954843.1 type II secretion system GspH family protein [Aeromonas simiae]
MHHHKRGFTLIEMVVGMSLMAIALTGVLSMLINLAPHTIDPARQVQAAQLAQRLYGEIFKRSFDEHSAHSGGQYRCGETVAGITYGDCTFATSYGPDGGETSPYLYNDVDDYHTKGVWVEANDLLQTSLHGTPNEEYRQFKVLITVTGVDFSSGSAGAFTTSCSDKCSIGKRIDMSILPPRGTQIDFTAFRGNY